MPLDTPISTLGPGAGTLEPVYNGELAVTDDAQFSASQSLLAGTVLGRVTADGKMKAYASGSSDGSQVPVGVLQYDIVVNSDGSIAFGQNITADQFGGTELTAPYFITGFFDTVDLVGLDANAVTLLGRIVAGNLAAGVLFVR